MPNSPVNIMTAQELSKEPIVVWVEGKLVVSTGIFSTLELSFN